MISDGNIFRLLYFLFFIIKIKIAFLKLSYRNVNYNYINNSFNKADFFQWLIAYC